MIFRLKRLFNKTPKVVRTGSCKRCGTCCRTITFMLGDKYVTEIEQFEKLKSLNKKFNHFYLTGKDENGILLFACKSLSKDNLCRHYLFRSLYCRNYPKMNSKLFAEGMETLDECGFYYKSSIEFKDFLKLDK